jgi:glutamyl-tRNA reductase
VSDPVQADHIQVRFATFRDGTSEERARLGVPDATASSAERVVLETCHRVEVVTVGPSQPGAIAGRAAVERVFTVVAGFDSAITAEEQLLGQVRDAYEDARASGSSGPILNELFRRAIRFGRRVRSHAMPGTDRSLADPGLAWLVGRVARPARVAVVGTGTMGRILARGLAEAGHRVVVVSRSADRAGALRDELAGGGHGVVIGSLSGEVVSGCDAIALAVRGASPALNEGLLHGEHLPWVLDLSAPPAVSAEAAVRLGDRLLALDAIGGRGASSEPLAPATERRLRSELTIEVDRFLAWLDSRSTSDAVGLLHREAEEVRRRHLDRLRRRAGLGPAQLRAVEAATAAIVGELLHGPSRELGRGGADAATVRRIFGIES